MKAYAWHPHTHVLPCLGSPLSRNRLPCDRSAEHRALSNLDIAAHCSPAERQSEACLLCRGRRPLLHRLVRRRRRAPQQHWTGSSPALGSLPQTLPQRWRPA